MSEHYSRRSFLAGVLAAGTLSTSASYVFTRKSSVSLTLMTGADPTGGRNLLVTLWNELNPDTRLNVEVVHSSTRDQFEKFTNTRADIYNLDTIHIPRFAEAGRIRLAAGEDGTTRLFSDLNLRYMRNWPVEYHKLEHAERAKPGTVEIRLGPLPVGILGGQSLAVAEDSRHRAQAERAVRFLTDTPAQKLLATFGFAPTCIDAYTDPAVLSAVPHLDQIRNAVERSRPRPVSANYAEFARRFRDHTYKHLHDGEELSDRFIRDIQEALR